jgi:hypothetical protein
MSTGLGGLFGSRVWEFSGFDCVPVGLRTQLPGRLIGRFQRNRYMQTAGEHDRHVGQFIADADGLDVGDFLTPRTVGNKNPVLANTSGSFGPACSSTSAASPFGNRPRLSAVVISMDQC